MKTIEINLLAETPNSPVLQIPGRKFPGVLIQGDSLKTILVDVENICRLSSDLRGSELHETAEYLRGRIAGYIENYELAMESHGLTLPYQKTK